jgi:uncharacterized membrane protein YccC
MSRSAEYKFLQQQGFPVSDEPSSKRLFSSLLFQPAIVGLSLLVAIIFQIPPLFIVLGLLLWFNALVPRANPFERYYDFVFGRRKFYPPLPPAPAPRRFMQGMAGTLMLLAGISLLKNWLLISYITQAFIAVAFSLLLFGKFCVGAYIYHYLTGNKSFADTTCPWSK